MSAKEFKALWKDKLSREWSDYNTLLSKDQFQNWHRDHNPECGAEDELGLALTVLYADGPSRFWQLFLDKCLKIVNRCISENKLTSPLCKNFYPLNIGQLLRTGAYAKALLEKSVDQERLIQASLFIEEWFNKVDKKPWDDQSQAHYLALIRLAMLANDITRATKLISKKNNFKWHPEEHRVLKCLLEHSKGPLPFKDRRLLEEFDAFFDRIRDPGFHSIVYTEGPVQCLELGAIRNKYFRSESGEVDWAKVVFSISR